MIARSLSRVDGVTIDCSAKISRTIADCLVQDGVRALWRYVSFHPQPIGGDLDKTELALLITAGLTVLVVQHVRNPGWHASSIVAANDAIAAISNAHKAGYEVDSGSPLSLALDLEGVSNPGSDAFAHADVWCRTVRTAGYAPVVYVGYASGLDSVALDSIGGEPAFWCDFAPLSARPRPTVGYALHQQAQSSMCGISVDVDAILQDGRLTGLAAGERNVEVVDDASRPTPTEPAAAK